MKKIIFLILICFFFLVGCVFKQKDAFTSYLNQNGYQPRKECLQKVKASEKDSGNITQRFCLDECKYYAMDSTLDDFFILDIQSYDINYVYDYITYKYNITKQKATCLFQGEEIDLESSYCKTAKILVDQHLDLFQQELNKADVKMKYICK